MDEFEEYVSTHWAELYRLASLIAGPETDVDDLMQEAVVKMMRSWPRFKSASRQRAYTRKLLTNASIDQTRRAKRLRDADAVAPHAYSQVALVGTQDGSDLWELVVSLPPRQRAIVVLRYYEDLSEREIAKTLGCRPGTVKSQCSAALKTMSARYIMGTAMEAGS